MPHPLSVIGHIAVPPTVMDHRFAAEALAAAREGGVVGTLNTKKCELFGWAENVDPHVDNTGYIYFVALNDGNSRIYLGADLDHEDIITVDLWPGVVVRMFDFISHWTEDLAPRCAAFIGSFKEPCDAEALQALGAGIAALGRGDYYGAPRVPNMFRAMLRDECWAANAASDDLEPMLLVDAKAQGRHIETCACCNKPAIRVDEYLPRQPDKSRCRDHLGGNE